MYIKPDSFSTTVIQKPNLLLIVAGIAYVLRWIPQSLISAAANTVFTMAIIIWAYQEATTGVNAFRKLLGAAVLLVMAISLFKQLQ
jgi:hypothetical protein